MRVLRTAVKGALLAAHVLLGAALTALPPRGLDERFARRWCRLACAILGLRVRAIGRPAPAAALYAANHVSWLEVVALGSLVPLGFVAKDDVRRWPVIGRLAACAGTLFLRRHSARAASRTMTAVLERLAEGRSVAVFPEGTSTDGATVLAFKAALFEAPARLGCDVQPVSVRYPVRPGRTDVAPFIGDDEFLPHLLRVLAEPGLDVELTFAAPLSGHGRTREELAGAARDAVVDALGLPGYSRSGERSLAAP
ncbi:MAG: 1-acyl-sn-glycerol-3-phosphate acyltransferase [Elusimicrobia bacterium]|nr:1-acyl-sn-glycerol-3-phosphate acyltransferase [Elusimicrobiota bacterium]